MINQHVLLVAIAVAVSGLFFPVSGLGSDSGDDKPPAYLTYSIDPETGKYTSNKTSPEGPADEVVSAESLPVQTTEDAEQHLPGPAFIGVTLLLVASAAFILTTKYRKRSQRT